MKKYEIIRVLKRLDTIKLPEKEKILSACPLPAACGDIGHTTRHRLRLKFKPVIALYVTLFLLILGLSGYVIASEVKNYNDAVIFFSEHDLSVNGLSRGEIKKVYKDITTGSFAYGKTAEVIEKSIDISLVGGYEIFQDEPTPEDLESLWNYKNYNGRYLIQNSVESVNDVSYKYYSEEKYDEKLGFNIHDKSIFEKYVDDKLIWSAQFNDFWIENYVVFGEKLIVYGQSPTWSSIQNRYAFMAMIDSNGSILWETKLNNEFKTEYIASIIPTDEKITVFSRGELKYLCLSEYDLNGNILSFYKNEVGNYGIKNAAKLADGYIVQLISYVTGEYARIVKVSGDGILTDSFSYNSEDSYYYITNMIEYNGNVYLSAYTVPVLENEENNAGGRYDIAAVLNYIFKNQKFNISNEELTELVRENFTAVLLVCDPASGTPQEFYSVKGSIGGELALSDSDKLSWDVESITDTFFSPMTSSFTIGGASFIYRYTFDKTGTILSREKTEEIKNFRR